MVNRDSAPFFCSSRRIAEYKVACGVAITCEDRNAVTILMFAWQAERSFKIGCADNLEDGAEDFFLIALHRCRDMIEQRRANEEALFMPLKRETATVDNEFGPFINAGLDPAFDACFVCCVDHRAIVRVGIG